MPLWRKLQLAAGALVALAMAAALANTQLPGNTLGRIAVWIGLSGFALILASRFVKGATDASSPRSADLAERGSPSGGPAERPGSVRAARTPAPVFERVDSSARSPRPPPEPLPLPEVPLLYGWIATGEADEATLEARIREHAGLSEPVVPVSIGLEIARRSDGTLDVLFDAGVPVYAFVNLVGWLGAHHSELWLENGELLQLAAPGDDRGDRITGVSSTNERVEVHLPDARLLRRGGEGRIERELHDRETVKRIRLKLDASEASGGIGWPGPAIPAPFDSLVTDPSPALGTLYRPDEERMEISIRDLERRHGGRLVFATTEWQDQWLLVHADGSWGEVQLEDGMLAIYPTSTHLAVELWIRAVEAPREAEELVPLAEALGLPDGGWLFAAYTPGPGEPYEAFRQRFLEQVLERA